MKVQLIIPCVMKNPNFDRKKPNVRGSDNFHILDLPPGTVEESPTCWELCLRTPQAAIPVDDEAIEKIRSIDPTRLERPEPKTKITLPTVPAK